MPATFETTVRPCRSTIGPRGASTRTRRSWLFWAAFRYSSPESTCSDQRRRKRTANTISATAPRTPTRSARAGVSRCGSRTRGSGGRNRSDGERRSRYAPSDNDLDLRSELAHVAFVDGCPDEQVDGEREHEVRKQRGDEHGHERKARHHVVSQHVVEEEGERAREHRDHADRDRGRELPAARGRLRPAAGPEPGERQDEGSDPERLQRQQIDDEPAREAEDCPRHRSSQQAQSDDRDEKQIRRAAADGEGRHNDHLQHGGHEDDRRRAYAFARAHCGRSGGRSTITASSAPKSTYGSTCTCWKTSVSVRPKLVTLPIGIPR